MTPEELRQMRNRLKAREQGLIEGNVCEQQAITPQQEAIEDAMAYNPMVYGSGQPDIRRVDRWLQYKRPKAEDENKFWVTETEMAEELAKANLTKVEYDWFVREYTEIESIAGGDGNEKWVRSRQRKFMMKLEATRSRSDNPERGLRDGTLLMTQNINQKSDVKIPSESPAQSPQQGGLFSFLRGR